MKSKQDNILYIVGIAVLLFVGWNIVGYLLPDKKEPYTAANFLNAVMESSGGLERWNNLQKVSYRKQFTLYDALGEVEIARDELHEYRFDSLGTRRSITWSQDTTNMKLVTTPKSLTQYVNGQVDSLATQQQLQNKLQAATFVFGLPYTLNGPNTTMTFTDTSSFQDQVAHRLEVRFDGSSDIWWLYYELETLKWLGYLVKTTDHYSLVINEEMQEVDGFTLSRKRKSYRSDSLMNIKYLRATYEYSNFNIK